MESAQRAEPKAEEKSQLRKVGRDCQRQGGKQDRVGDPGKREFQEGDNRKGARRPSRRRPASLALETRPWAVEALGRVGGKSEVAGRLSITEMTPL